MTSLPDIIAFVKTAVAEEKRRHGEDQVDPRWDEVIEYLWMYEDLHH